MTKEFDCRSAGVDCPFMIRDENEDEMASLVQQHARTTHQKSMSKEDILRNTREM
ncbi:putative small metal-binding protein [Candidatus Methanoperedens nitroreducens]|uniref:Putative small metal-binding protein n=1 Tax=Candidatus Methanoperedens nitratireducens TaxID=1392998 RepID=A0A062UZJ9_9EURY|nr:DUF1059 domain-containing protein [Candidatus Methanoperedens nitroreducens]KCZ70592.1 putative small metal-binding protein [Candidatus Methanoperedens nitroreducens]MDJ1420446.1 DUF1059 domain-containing protein [Candidatus Methanoperedens sp.]